MANLQTKVKKIYDEIAQICGERVQKWLLDSYSGSNDDIHSTKTFKIVQTSKNSMVTVWSQLPESMVAGIPQNVVSVGDKTHVNDFSNLLA
jgi:hypothetical protein